MLITHGDSVQRSTLECHAAASKCMVSAAGELHCKKTSLSEVVLLKSITG